MSIRYFEIRQLPDLSLNKYQSLADTGVDGLLNRHESFLRQWHGICSESNTSCHLLYVYNPARPVGKRMGVYFALQGKAEILEMIRPLLFSSPLSDFYTFEDAEIPDIVFNAGTTFTKKERVADIYNPLTGQSTSVHYVADWEVNDKARLYDLFKMMKTIGQSYGDDKACAFRVDMYPASLGPYTRQIFNPILKALRGENDIKVVNGSDSMKSDSYAKDIVSEYEDWLTAIETEPHFRVNIYGFAESAFGAKMLLNAAGSEAVYQGDFAIAQIKADENGHYNLLSRMGEQPEDYCFFPNQAHLRSWSTTFCLSEIKPFFRFPVLYDGEAIEIPKETAPVPLDNGLYFGRDMNGYPVKFALKDLPRHAFFTGMPGSGKTNTMLHMVTELRKNGIPFLAMEPAKKEYRSLLTNPDMQDVYLFSPHLQSLFPLQINPLEFPKGVRLSEHINALLEVFEGSFSLEGPTYKFLSSSIQAAYTNLGWDIEDTNDENTEFAFPCLKDVCDNLKSEIDSSSYDNEIKGNVRAFLQVRLGSLMERDAGEVFNAPVSTIDPGNWLNISAIVELEVLGEQAKNFFVLLVCHYILESLRANPNGGVDEYGKPVPVRHTIFIEEAHNIIADSAQQASGDSVDPKISATAYIVKMLAEVRALREAIVIADQLPTALAPEVTKNTGLKLVHRLTSKDDRGQIGTAISATPLQLEQMATFTTGRALIYHERTQKPYEIQIAEWIAQKVGFDPANDKMLYATVAANPTVERAVRVALYNWQEKALFATEERVNELEQKCLKLGVSDGTGALACIREKDVLMKECDRMEMKCRRYEKLWMNEHSKAYLEESFRDCYQFIADLKTRVAEVPIFQG